MLIEGLPGADALRVAGATLGADLQSVVDLCIAIQQIPAPTGAEAERAAWIERRMRSIDLANVGLDDLGNVYARVPGSRPAPALLISAHTDTVFPSRTDLRLRRLNNGYLQGAGIGDNAAGVAGLLTLAELLRRLEAPPVDIWLVANAMEEGIGDLRGMRAVVDRLNARPGESTYRGDGPRALGAVIVLEGMGLGRVVHQALGVRRYRTSAAGPGGHSWSDYGAASAVHGLVATAQELLNVELPDAPRTTFNIGRIGGGASVNSIAQEAWMELDLRSESPETLLWLDRQAAQIVERRARADARDGDGLLLRHERIGRRPAGQIPFRHPLVQAACGILRELDIEERSDARISSTDANVPLSRNIPAVCIGLTDGGNAHRPSEWIDPSRLPKGMQQLLYLTWWCAAWLTT